MGAKVAGDTDRAAGATQDEFDKRTWAVPERVASDLIVRSPLGLEGRWLRLRSGRVGAGCWASDERSGVGPFPARYRYIRRGGVTGAEPDAAKAGSVWQARYGRLWVNPMPGARTLTPST